MVTLKEHFLTTISIFALGRRLATERITGFYEHAHHLLNVDKAIKFGKAIATFTKDDAVIGQCAGARLANPGLRNCIRVSTMLKENNERDRVRITIVSPDEIGSEFGDRDVGIRLQKSLWPPNRIPLRISN